MNITSVYLHILYIYIHIVCISVLEVLFTLSYFVDFGGMFCSLPLRLAPLCGENCLPVFRPLMLLNLQRCTSRPDLAIRPSEGAQWLTRRTVVSGFLRLVCSAPGVGPRLLNPVDLELLQGLAG